MNLPNYKDGSIVNLMSSISSAFGLKSGYGQLKIFPSKELARSRNVVLMILDGIGFEYLTTKGKGTFLEKNLKGRMTSVFPPTTASAITTFTTGAATQQHAFTGWFMHLKELGIVSEILPFHPRSGGPVFSNFGIYIDEILDVEGIPARIKAKSFVVCGNEIKDSDFTRFTGRNAKMLGYKNLDGFFKNIRNAVKSGNKRKYVYAYWPDFDSISHTFGVDSKKAEKHLRQINQKLSKFVKSIKGTNTALIITADHGLIDTTKKRMLLLKDHPRLRECLSLPFCGEPRTVYCYVHPSKTKQFESYVKKKLSKFCWMFKSEDMIKKNVFGLFKPNPKLLDRIGDYVLIMKENYIFKDNILAQKRHFHIGNHGGVSKEEMFVPLIVINA